MATDLDLANRALNAIGQDPIPSLDNTVNSKTISTVNLHLSPAKLETLRAHDWNSVRGRIEPNLLPTDRSFGEWGYSYRLPTDFLCFRRFISQDPKDAYAPYSIEIDSENKPTLLTDIPSAKIIYTRNITDFNRWDVLLQMAAVCKLALHLVGPIVRDTKMQQYWYQAMEAGFTTACGVDEAEGGMEIATDSNLIDVRF
jgi:hypothetical protein